LPYVKPKALVKAEKIVETYPELSLKNLNDILDLHRMIKDEFEVKSIETAIHYAQKGLEAIWKSAKPGVNEHELEALFEYATKAAGSEGNSFSTIAASGKNATVLHYEENNQVAQKGNLVLLDLGCLSSHYASDISRTWPVSGTFSERQKVLYQLVLNVNKQCIEYVKPGLMVSELNAYAKKLLAEGAIKIGLIQDASEIDRYYYHNVSHYLGLDVHDVGTYQVPLAAGVVLTIEPGIYVEEEAIGIRIEDNVLVTETGHRNLSKGIIKEIADIEAFMKK
jgi:Xaa-Pro aminopeptidase